MPAADAVFLALPHGAAVEQAPGPIASRAAPRSSTSAPISGCATRPTTRAGTASSIARPDLLAEAVYGLPELHRAELEALAGQPVRIVGSPGCYATASILALAPLARAGLIGDVVIDAKSGVSGAGREPKPELHVRRGQRERPGLRHRRPPPRRRDRAGDGFARWVAGYADDRRAGAPAGPGPIDFLPHLIPMTRGILAAAHVRPTRPTSQAELDELFARRLRRRAVRAGRRRRPRRRSTSPAATRPGSRSPRRPANGRILVIWRPRQPGQGRRRPGRPVVQPRPRPARDEPASSSSRWRHDHPRRPGLGRARASPSTALPRPPPGRSHGRPAGRLRGRRDGGRDQGQRPARPGRRSDDRRSGRRGRGLHPAPVRGRAGPPQPNRHLRATWPVAGGGFGWAEAIVSTSGCANAATGEPGLADQARSRRLRGPGGRVAAERTLHLSTGIIGTRLPLATIAAGLAPSSLPAWARPTKAARRSPRPSGRPIRGPSSRPRSSTCPTSTASPSGRSPSAASPRASG